jgi:hypothetical protein
MVVNDTIVNKPSDGYERPVSSALLLLPGPDPTPIASPAPIPTASPSPSPSPSSTSLPPIGGDPQLTSRDIWLSIARDPASTGGLAQWLLHEGVRLSPSLAKAAQLFRGR